MARLVVVEFQSNQEAEEFAQSHPGVWGVYPLPTAICNCPDNTRRTVTNWARGKNTRVWVCVKCRRASRFWVKGIPARLEVALGRNMKDPQ